LPLLQFVDHFALTPSSNDLNSISCLWGLHPFIHHDWGNAPFSAPSVKSLIGAQKEKYHTDSAVDGANQ
jgi:hypothetical protein